MDNKKEITLASYERCTGCMACRSSCPTAAIQLTQDKLGFYYPIINENLCVACQKCTKVCPELYPVSRGNKNPECYAAQTEDAIRMNSSSGGVFSLLAGEVLKQGGIVYGAYMNAHMRVKHICVQNLDELPNLRGSKYVQSELGETYHQVQEQLKHNKMVLYVGSPCQIAGLRKTLQQDTHPCLITIDLLCSGVSSQDMFLNWLSTKYPLDSIAHLVFRDKKHGQGWRCDSMFIRTADGGEHSLSSSSDSFLKAFQDRLIFREGCYHCQYSTRTRVGDISLGDFWGVEEYNKELNDNKGTSLVLVNTPKGEKLFNAIENKLVVCTPVSADYSPHNPIHGQEKSIPQERMRLHDLLPRQGFQKALDYASNKRYDVGVVGCWSVENHGSNLSYYALYQFLRDSGFETLMIERPRSSAWKPNDTPIWFNESPYQPYDLCPVFDNLASMRRLNERCSTFVVGSDQLFYHELYDAFGEFADLSYIDSYHKKVAYAASVGRNHFDGSLYQKAKLSHFLQEFDEISVRETDAVELFENTFHVKATQVLDPVFLCDKKYYDTLAERGAQSHKMPHIFAYILDPSEEKAKILHQLSRDLNMPIKVFGDVAKKSVSNSILDWDFSVELSVSNETWVRAFRDASFVITDSFHGTCFAILFEKQFFSIVNRYRGTSRFSSLLSQVGLEGRMIDSLSDYQQLKHEQIIYLDIAETVREKIAQSKKWLLTAINLEKRPVISTYDLLDSRLSATENVLQIIRKKTYNTESWLSNTHKRVDSTENRVGVYEKDLHILQEAQEIQQEAFSQLQKAVEEIQCDRMQQSEERRLTFSQLQQAVEEIQNDRALRDEQQQMVISQLQQAIEAMYDERNKQIAAYDASLRELQKATRQFQIETEAKLIYTENVMLGLQEEMERFKKSIWYRIYEKTRGGKS